MSDKAQNIQVMYKGTLNHLWSSTSKLQYKTVHYTGKRNADTYTLKNMVREGFSG